MTDQDLDPELYQIIQEGIDLDESIERLEGSIKAQKQADADSNTSMGHANESSENHRPFNKCLFESSSAQEFCLVVNKKLKDIEKPFHASLDHIESVKNDRMRHTSPQIFVPILEINKVTTPQKQIRKKPPFENVIGMDIDGDDRKIF